MYRNLILAGTLAALTGCASTTDRFASLPVVTFPAAPPAGAFILRIPGGEPIPTRVAIQGSALADTAVQTLTVTLPSDLYLHGEWARFDGGEWRPAEELLQVDLKVLIPSYEHPAPGEITLKIDRKAVGQ